MILLTNGMCLTKAATVFGAALSSKWPVNVYGPAMTFTLSTLASRIAIPEQDSRCAAADGQSGLPKRERRFSAQNPAESRALSGVASFANESLLEVRDFQTSSSDPVRAEAEQRSEKRPPHPGSDRARRPPAKGSSTHLRGPAHDQRKGTQT